MSRYMTIVILWYKYKFIHNTTSTDEIAISHKKKSSISKQLNEIHVLLKWDNFFISLHTFVMAYVPYKYV